MPYKLHILAGPNTSTLKPTTANPPASDPPTRISPTTSIRIHIRSRRTSATGSGGGGGSSGSSYFSAPAHASTLFSITYTFAPAHDIGGDELVLANTFARPIRAQLPYFFPAAWAALRRFVDPAIDGDCYADAPEVFGPVLASVNFLDCEPEEEEEGGQPAAAAAVVVHENCPKDVPKPAEARRRWFLDPERRKNWRWRRGHVYRWDFCNALMDFNDFSVRIPGLGFKIEVFKYWDGQPLRFVLKNKRTGEEYGVVQLELREEEDERGMTVPETVVDDGLEEAIRETEVQ
ncbi:hypothetical protein FN846DRAFT_58689 [Sphaerosporella brunnea]|uniref:Domain of unknown function at the cortex 1 domain-containing protein n=1 Tax=Sphaerosporella brunnea TaxID=1250544 RepID=A0A5J5F9U9_9PEZI|nr:hypothetical protein FN846DRAFT_58689 [Sphaerosporella brunnea]